MLVLVVGCDPSLRIIDPPEGAVITTPEIVLTAVGDNINVQDVYVYSDVPDLHATSSHFGDCDGCRFTVSFYDQMIPNGVHVLRVRVEYDLSLEAEAEITLEFAR